MPEPPNRLPWPERVEHVEEPVEGFAMERSNQPKMVGELYRPCIKVPGRIYGNE